MSDFVPHHMNSESLPGLWLRKDFVSDNLIFDNAYIIYVIMVITARGKAI